MFCVAGRREEGTGAWLIVGAECALMGVLVGLDAMKADLVSAGSTEQVVGLALAGVAASALLHRIVVIDFINKNNSLTASLLSTCTTVEVLAVLLVTIAVIIVF